MRGKYLTLCWWFIGHFVFAGCGDNSEQVVNFIAVDPPEGSRIPNWLPPQIPLLKLTFDRSPRSVTVNGTPAAVEGNAACLEHSGGLRLGDGELTVAWTNQDGSQGVGVILHFQVVTYSAVPPEIAGGSVTNGDIDVDPAPLNLNGITIFFSEAIRPGTIEIRPEGQESLGWIAQWKTESVEIMPLPGKELIHGTAYIIKLENVEDLVGASMSVEIWFMTRA